MYEHIDYRNLSIVICAFLFGGILAEQYKAVCIMSVGLIGIAFILDTVYALIKKKEKEKLNE